MPEGDTIFRISQNLGRHLIQKRVAKSYLRPIPYSEELLVGKVIEDVTSIGKNLFIVFEDDRILRAHSKMFGSWHLYSPGVRWKRSARHAVCVIETGDVVAVAFDVPLLQLGLGVERTLGSFRSELGSDLIRDELEVETAFMKLRQFSGDVSIGEALLDQRIVAGIGNIYRCETLFKVRMSPYRPAKDVAIEELAEMLEVARSDLKFNATQNANVKRVFDSDIEGTFVYGRSGLPCRICTNAVRRRTLGSPNERIPRPIFYCPNCQV
ncbi:MAG: hypothetical protein M0019_06195 [Actinomycetota bacterium]|nr:hypothetical protein [Actinomycetota bacterium]